VVERPSFKVLEDRDYERLADVFTALANPLRLRILDLVSTSDRPLHIKAVAKLTKTKYSLAYKHVRLLEKANLVTIYEVGRSRVVALKSQELLQKAFLLGQEALAVK
jgi:DNA-binding transcriptional ArsR family regulator